MGLVSKNDETFSQDRATVPSAGQSTEQRFSGFSKGCLQTTDSVETQ